MRILTVNEAIYKQYFKENKMYRSQGWTIGFVISAVLWCLLISGIMCVAGCGDPMTDGVLIGLGVSTATTDADASTLASERKTALVAEILRLRSELASAATPEQHAALQEQLDEAQRKQELSELTTTIADIVKAGLERDWGEKPTQGKEGVDNLAYIMTAIAGIATTYAGKKTYDVVQKDKAINRVKVASKSNAAMETGDVYKAINGA